MDFIVFSDDWGEHPSSSQHLFRQIARDHRVLWVNTVGMRRPRLNAADLRKAARKLRHMLRRTPAAGGPRGSVPPENLVIVQPPMLPLPGLGAARAFNDWSAIRVIRSALTHHGMSRPVVVTTVPNACDVVDHLDASLIVYYCVDDFAAWPGNDRRVVQRMEARLIARADVLLATSGALFEALRSSGKPTLRFDHGVDAEHFAGPCGREHPRLASLPKPRAGFFGLLDERVDDALLAQIARRMPEWTFVLAGPQVAALAQSASCPNIIRIGSLPYTELPPFVDGVDVLIIPYRGNEFTQTISPLTLTEYLATGRPVVSSALAESARRGPLVRIAGSADEWVDALRRALHDDRHERLTAVADLLRGLSWREKSVSFLELIEARIGRR